VDRGRGRSIERRTSLSEIFARLDTIVCSSQLQSIRPDQQIEAVNTGDFATPP
jgi:hypothetical protein